MFFVVGEKQWQLNKLVWMAHSLSFGNFFSYISLFNICNRFFMTFSDSINNTVLEINIRKRPVENSFSDVVFCFLPLFNQWFACSLTSACPGIKVK